MLCVKLGCSNEELSKRLRTMATAEVHPATRAIEHIEAELGRLLDELVIAVDKRG